MPRRPRPAAPPSSASLRRELLRDALLATVELLRSRRACEISEGYIDDYVALNWLEWSGGALGLTTTGQNICLQLKSRT